MASSLEHTAPHLSIYEESNAPDSDSWCMDHESAPAAPDAPTSPPSSPSSRRPDSAPPTTPTSPHLHASKPQPSSPDTWEEDTALFPAYSWLYPSEPNGTWLSSAIQRPSSAISSINSSQIRHALSEVGDVVSDRLTHALDGKDLPAMHDRAVSYLTPSVSMPSLRQVSQGVDRWTDGVQEAFARGRRQGGGGGRAVSAAPASSVVEEKAGEEVAEARDQFTFAATMSSRAINALVAQSIPADATQACQKRLEAALVLLFLFHQEEYGADALFNMNPVWKADADANVWHLKLDTGIVEVVAVEGEECVEKAVCLDVDFEVGM